VFQWHKRFVQGRDSLEDDEHTSQPGTVRTELKIQEAATLVRTNHSKMVDEVTAAAGGISCGSCHKIPSDDLNMPHVTQHSVPCILTQDQHEDLMGTWGDLNDCDNKDGTFLKRIIKGDETWYFLYDP
jgi:hypothetical protein